MAMVVEPAQCHHLPSLAREGIAMLRTLLRPTLRARDTVQGLGNGAMIETFGDAAGKVVRKSAGDTEALADMAAETDAARVWIKVELPGKGTR